MKKFTVDKDTNLKDFTDSTYPQGSFYLNALLRLSDVRVNGVKVNKSVPLKAGDEVTYYTNAAQESKESHKKLYEDEKIYAADKFSGVSTEALACELGLLPVHRLDRNTCGVLLFAKSQEVKDALVCQFSDKKVQKTYLCFAKNNFKKQFETLISYLSKDSKESKVKISDRPKDGFTKIITQYKVLSSSKNYALVEVILHTGKTHQIRAHLAHIGCPVLGDEKYGDEALNKKYGAKRQILISKRIAFTLDGRNYEIESSFVPELPDKKS
ncbi:MAG: RluA family pseudouridine synthase [Candidatus Coproplasma sp.]